MKFRISLKTLLLIVTLLAAVLACVGYWLRATWVQQTAVVKIESRYGSVKYEDLNENTSIRRMGALDYLDKVTQLNLTEDEGSAGLAAAKNLRHVKKIEAWGQYFDSLDQLAEFEQLEDLLFEKCEFLDWNGINKVHGLKCLAFFECNYGKPLSLTGPFPKLEKLSLGGWAAAEPSILKEVGKFVSLKELAINLSDKVTDSDLQSLCSLKSLTKIHMSGAKGRSLDFLGSTVELEHLFLDGVDNIALPNILSLPKLKYLHLGGIELSPSDDLTGLNRIEQLSIYPATPFNLEVMERRKAQQK